MPSSPRHRRAGPTVVVLVALLAACSSGTPQARPNPSPVARTPSPSPPPPSASVSPTRTPGGDPVVAAVGDIACPPGRGPTPIGCRQAATAQLAVNAAPDAVIVAGDLQYPSGRLADFRGSYAKSWGRLLDRTHPAPGNHEYGTPGAAGYFAYFGTRAGDPSRGWYSFDVGAWHLVALNSNCWAVGGCEPTSPQGRWLRADLAAHRNVCTLAYMHHPRFSSGLHGGQSVVAGLWDVLYAAGADVVVAGHDHDYERFAPQSAAGTADPRRGIREFVVGTGGFDHYVTLRRAPNSEVRSSLAFGVLLLTLHARSYDWRFVPTRPALALPGSGFTDHGTGRCH